MAKSFLRFMSIIGTLLLVSVTVLGQTTDELCERFINSSFQQVSANCSGLSAATSCYAYGDIFATFFINGTPLQTLSSFDESNRVTFDGSDRSVVESLEGTQFELNSQNVDASDWGISIQKVRANLPDEASENIVIISFGDTRIENSVLPEDAFILGDDIPVSYNRVTVYSSPQGLNYPVPSELIETLSGGGRLDADAISPDGQWLRIFYPYDKEFGERLTAWVPVGELGDVNGIEELPTLGPDTYTTMQNFYLTNSNNQPGCEIVPPPGIMVQGPNRTESDLVVNDLPLRVTSTAFVRVVGDFLHVTAVDGITITEPDTPNEQVLAPGFTAVFCLSPFLDLGIDTLPNDRQVELDNPGCRSIISPEQNRGLLEQLISLGLLPENVIIYPPRIPIVICSSGVGGVVCSIRSIRTDQLGNLCDEGVIPEEQCEAFGF